MLYTHAERELHLHNGALMRKIEQSYAAGLSHNSEPETTNPILPDYHAILRLKRPIRCVRFLHKPVLSPWRKIGEEVGGEIRPYDGRRNPRFWGGASRTAGEKGQK